jgi:hypothetical protein
MEDGVFSFLGERNLDLSRFLAVRMAHNQTTSVYFSFFVCLSFLLGVPLTLNSLG